ncbi:right-handed parallel beta-helix repeat-containing protein [Ruegeria sp. HKCCD7255]|uniref:right-handed parallel beta-helix repeat-containing protein n=1 Tax=Ruegeria sp. HKCCD7255 TaxID=2683004 RepID=UPI0014887148|nr:right-handed parallel beta-helix repeat-containing protein [Ruegeria sp. HKCCD7255]
MTIYNATNAAELTAALSSASGGDEIRLSGGDYGALNISKSFNSEVRIVSNDPSNPASFSTMNINGASNITIEGVVFDYTFSSGDKIWDAPFQINNSSNVAILNSTFDGDVASGLTSEDNGYGAGKGLTVNGSNGVTIAGNEVYDFWKGMNFSDSKNLIIQNNELHSLRSDGLNFVDVQGVLIERNYIHDFDASPTSGDHRDMIQFWTNNTTEATSNVVIRDNTFDIGQGSWTQTIFMRNIEAEKGNTALYYQNVTIENNVIYNSHLHGITVGETNGLVVSNNTLVQADGDPNFAKVGGAFAPPQISIASNSKNVTIDQNITSKITGFGNQSDWTVQSNAIIQNTDPTGPGYYADVFTNQSLNDNTPYHNYDVIPGSIIDLLNAGAILAHPEESQSSVSTPTTSTPTTTTPVVTDPVNTTAIDPVQTTDSTTGTGSVDADPVNTANGSTGSYDVSSIGIDAFVLDIDTLIGTSALKGDAEIVTTASGESAIYLDGKKDSVDLGRLKPLEDSDQVSFSIEFARDTADGATERLVWNHKKIGVSLVDDGLEIQVANKSTKFYDGIVIKDLGLNDTDVHQLTVIVDAETDRLQVIVDGELVLDEQSYDFDIVGAGGKEWGWSLGPKWGDGFDGEIYDFRIDDQANFFDTTNVIDDSMAVFG